MSKTGPGLVGDTPEQRVVVGHVSGADGGKPGGPVSEIGHLGAQSGFDTKVNQTRYIPRTLMV